MIDKTKTLVVDENDEVFHWAYCAVPECCNRVCTWLSNTYCYPHTISNAKETTKEKELAA